MRRYRSGVGDDDMVHFGVHVAAVLMSSHRRNLLRAHRTSSYRSGVEGCPRKKNTPE